MRNYIEPTARNLLRKPLVMGVPFLGLVLLAFVVLVLFLLVGSSGLGNALTGALAVVGYLALRVTSRFAKSGWEGQLILPVEKLLQRKGAIGKFESSVSSIEIVSPDTLDEDALIACKEGLAEQIAALRPRERLTWVCDVTDQGASLHELRASGRFDLRTTNSLEALSGGWVRAEDHLYSLHQLPVATDPLWLFSQLAKLKAPYRVFVGLRGVDQLESKRRIEIARKSSAGDGSRMSNIDSDITFEESSQVLRGLSRGDETVVEISLVVVSQSPLELDPALFVEESKKELTAASICGSRNRFFRSHLVRLATATDLIPNVLDPKEDGSSILTTLRGSPLYFSPQDPRLEALHWLVVGASGSGKSFFTGLVLKRMIEQGCAMSVVFVDHNRSFRRFVRSTGGAYFEPKGLKSLESDAVFLFDSMNQSGAIAGIELSDLDLHEKKAAVHTLLSRIETFLRFRDTTHPVYIVLDECWNFMRDNPLLVQRAFREFRKLNGAVIAITQSLHDFLTDESGQSIFQNAPIRVLLRQGEDLGIYQGALALNSVEMSRVRVLRQKRGVYSECIIKTPFLSRLGRLYPTEAEHCLLRTDDLRAELIAEARKVTAHEVAPCQ